MTLYMYIIFAVLMLVVHVYDEAHALVTKNTAASSLLLDSFEQFCVWQLLCAEGPDCSLVIPAIGKLDTDGTYVYM